jgi:peptide/nickel transport system permease protein
MLVYVVRRLASGVVLLVLLTFVTYLVVNEIPQNKACLVTSCDSSTPDSVKRAALHQAGLDRPIWVQYGKGFLWPLVRHGTLGRGWSNIQIGPTISAALPATASLVLGGMILMLLLAVPFGCIAALRPRSLADRGLLTFSLTGLAIHPFVLGLGLRDGLAHAFGTPRHGYCPLTTQSLISRQVPGQPFTITPGPPKTCGGIEAWASHMIVPWIVFALFFLPLYVRMIRTRLVDTLGERYVTTARAKGAGETRVVVRHALRNAAGPLLPMVALDAGTAITAAIYIDTVFGLPGLGHLAVMGLSGEFFQGLYDLKFINAIVFTVGIFVVLLSTAADATSAWIDPRVRERTSRGLIPLPTFLRRPVV